MACNRNYVPNPPRTWYRVQRPPIEYLPPNEQQKMQAKQKGNVLQYKQNSSNLSKKMIYSKMAQDNWTKQQVTYATQNSNGYTNPNNKLLKRMNNINIAIDANTGAIIGPTDMPITCPTIPSGTAYSLPNKIKYSGSSKSQNPELPPITPNTSGNNSDSLPEIPNPYMPPKTIVIADEGTLLCGTLENPCANNIGMSDCQMTLSNFNRLTNYIESIETFFYTYSLGNIDAVANILNLNTYETILGEFAKLKMDGIKYSKYETLRLNYVYAISGLYQSLLQNTIMGELRIQLKTALDRASILDDPEKLNAYINSFKSSIFPDSSITIIKATIKPQYAKYIELYGVPSNGIFDPDLLGQIISNL